MTPFASVAILEKLALLKIALCRAPALSNASSACWRSVISARSCSFNFSAASVSSCWRTDPRSNASFIASIFSCNWAVSSIWAVFLLLRLRFRRSFFFLRLSRAGARGCSCGQPVVVRGSRADDHHALVRDDIFADVFAVIAAAHFDHDHHFAKLAVNFHITHPDNVIGQKRNRILAKGQRGKCILHTNRAENRDPGSIHPPAHSV